MSTAASVGSSVMGASAAGRSASAAASADRQASQMQMDMYHQTRSDLLPYNQMGQANIPAYQDYWKASNAGLSTAYDNAQANIPQLPSNDTLENLPGYQFTRDQGLKGVANSAAARGLGVSGAALQGAGTYATGLANSNWQNYWNAAQQRYQDYSTQFSNAYNRSQLVGNQLSGTVNLGESAAAATGQAGTAAAKYAGDATQNAGLATAAGITGQAQSINTGINAVGNAGINYLGINNALKKQP